MAAKTKIVLDADVIIHFIKGGQFSLLLDIFPEYEAFDFFLQTAGLN
ncbi:MAG: hypothetical protein K2M31_04520 [Muribaculaceae bacterium]|nr:hypothetical protein [Muribaculaceae bacterium]